MAHRKIVLSEVPRALREMGVKISYQRAWGLVVSGDLPAERIGKFWHVNPDDLPKVAETLAGR